MDDADISAEERDQFLKEYKEAVNAFRDFCVRYNLTASGAYNQARRYEKMSDQDIGSSILHVVR